MRAIVLAAGRGTRLRPFTDHHPKCLVDVGGATLLRRHLDLLSEAGVEEIAIVVGYLAEQVRAEAARARAGAAVRLVENPRFEAGSALSLLAALPPAETASLVVDADLLYSRRLLARLLASRHPNCLLADAQAADTGEEVKVLADAGGRVVELTKRVRGAGRVVGESVGLYRFAPHAASRLGRALGEAVAADPNTEYEQVIDRLLDEISVGWEPADGEPWIEIDFPEDIERARRAVYPRLAAAEGAG